MENKFFCLTRQRKDGTTGRHYFKTLKEAIKTALYFWDEDYSSYISKYTDIDGAYLMDLKYNEGNIFQQIKLIGEE